jgi:hypothetical protein
MINKIIVSLKRLCIFMFMSGTAMLNYSCSSSQRALSDQWIKVPVNGYIRTCMTVPDIYVKGLFGWRKADNTPLHGIFFIDDRFVLGADCDLVDNVKVDSFSVSLVEYREFPKRHVPKEYEQNVTGNHMVKVYRSVPIKGEIKIQIDYFTDSTCTDKKIATSYLKR